jgi:inorganic pyrophosphatase/exopolyphosphatase
MASFSQFLSAASKALRERRQGTFTRKLSGVLGNEGGDMDSVVSAIYTAYYFNLTAGVAAGEVEQNHDVWVPLINFPLEDLPLRGDILYALNLNQVRPEDLVWASRSEDAPAAGSAASADADGVQFADMANPSDVALFDSICLVDHNIPCERQSLLREKVKAVVDHHKDEGLFPDAAPRIINKAGSASSNVALLFKAKGLSTPSPKLLLAPILLDTSNLDPEAKKVTPIDLEAVDYLLSQYPTTDVEVVAGQPLHQSCHKILKKYYKELHERKADISHLDMDQSLRRDFKAFPFSELNVSCGGGSAAGESQTVKVSQLCIGISSVMELEAGFYARLGGVEKVIPDLVAFCIRKKCDVGMIMFHAKDQGSGEKLRQLSIFVLPSEKAPNHNPVQDVTLLMEHFIHCNSGAGTAGLRVVTNHLYAESGVRHIYCTQQDISVSRKGLTPALAASLTGKPSSL